MGYVRYSDYIAESRRQHNIMALVGNGFDIQVLTDLRARTDTRYEKFYRFLQYHNFNQKNLIFAEMGRLHGLRVKNWSDVEAAIGLLHERRSATVAEIASAIFELQGEFSRFLDEVVTPEVLTNLGVGLSESGQSIVSLTEFMGDIDALDEYQKFALWRRVDIGDVFNFHFIDFNYTSLLDDYIYLDRQQFDPHPFGTSERHVLFHPNPQGHDLPRAEREGFTMVANVVVNVEHPHGMQQVPRSLLFGIDQENVDATARQLVKRYWAQNDTKYAHLFADTDLFIIFGCSLGDSDRWWWRHILNSLRNSSRGEGGVRVRDDVADKTDAIIYWRPSADEEGITPDEVREKLLVGAGFDGDDEVRDLVRDRVRVVIYDDCTPRAWLNSDPNRIPSWAAPIFRP